MRQSTEPGFALTRRFFFSADMASQVNLNDILLRTESNCSEDRSTHLGLLWIEKWCLKLYYNHAFTLLTYIKSRTIQQRKSLLYSYWIDIKIIKCCCFAHIIRLDYGHFRDSSLVEIRRFERFAWLAQCRILTVVGS